MGLSVAARYTTPAASERAYKWLTAKLATDNLAVSCFRFYSEPYWYIAVVGEETELSVFGPLAEILARRGEIIALPDETRDALLVKRSSAKLTPP